MANNTDNKDAFESLVSELQRENELLLVQLHHAQEELERNYSGTQPVAPSLTTGSKSGVTNASVIASGWVADELPEMHAENRRLQALVDAQKKIHERESNHALNAWLGNILIEGVDAPVSLFSVPGKLVRIWRQSTRRIPPAALGGKDFSKVIAAWQSGGFNAVEKVIGAQSIAPAMQAQGYTALARHLGKDDRANAAEAARRAYDLDPKAFRLKWLAFRLHEAGDVVEAEAMLELLPVDTQFSESEARQAKQLRNEAKRARDSEAKQKTAFAERRAAAEKQLSNLARERDQQSRLAIDREREVTALKQSKAKLEQEKTILSARHESQARLLDECNRELEALKHAKSQLQKENALLVEQRDQSETELRDALDASIQKSGDNELLLENLHRVQEELEQVFAERESLQRVNVQLDAQVCDAQERARELEALKAAKATVEQELQALAVRHEVELRIAEERLRELDALRQTKALLEQEKQSLTIRHEVLSNVVAERAKELDTLKQTKMQLEQEKHALTTAQEAQARAMEERTRQIDLLKQEKTKLEQEKHSLTVRHEVLSGVAAERAKELDALKQTKMQVEQEKHALSTTQEAQAKVVEEHTRQIDLLKQAKTKLEQEKQLLIEGRDMQARIAEERGGELTSLKQAKAKLEQEKAALEKLKRAIVPKTNKGDADIDDLLVDLELFFNGKAIIYVDVGAYVGDVFLKIKRSSKRFRIHEAHLFEPNPNSYAQLTSKISGSDSTVVHTYNLAIAESSDTHRFIPAKSMTKALSVDLVSEPGPGDVFTARCVSLDSQAPIFTDGKINLLKIDVEGKEMDVLASARKLLERQSIDILYIEVGFNRSGTQQTYFAEVDQFLQTFGYRVLRIYEQKEEWMRDSPLLRRANIAYMSEKFANAHPLKLMQELQELKNRLNELTDGMLKSER
ncbi:FkbM family methyltransferase [Paraburkholderia sp.]|uniref:FkbM family methyltransferase n=1 Tax=Paraburkholderia sp. TaxID=1926495 RepID=UPI0039E27956